MPPLRVPQGLASNCSNAPERAAWLARLPEALGGLERRWSLTVGEPYEQASCAWVAPVAIADRAYGVLKLLMPHMEGEHEIQGLRLWNGDPTVGLLASDDSLGAMLLERCDPGTALSAVPEPEQDVVITGLLRRLWRSPAAAHCFRPLSVMTEFWSNETLAKSQQWPDSGLVAEALRLFKELPRTAHTAVLLATDLHAGNVLRSQRDPWLVIDPKPFVGDRAYDATQHLLNCRAKMRADPHGRIRRIADLLELHFERVRLWMFTRAAAEPRDNWRDEDFMRLAKAIAP